MDTLQDTISADIQDDTKSKSKSKPGRKPGFKMNQDLKKQSHKELSLKKKALIVKSLAAGHTLREIEDALQTSQTTIQAIATIHHDSIEMQRKKLAGRLVSIAPQVLDRIESQIQDKSFVTPTKDLAITAGIILDKYERMTGQPTQVIQVTHSDPGRAEYEAWLQCKTIDVVSDKSNLPPAPAAASPACDTRGGGVPYSASSSEVQETSPLQKNDTNGKLSK